MPNDFKFDESRRAAYVERLSILERSFQKTGNPFYAWGAVSLLSMFNSAQRSPSRSENALPELEWPSWVLEYLGRAAVQIVYYTSDLASSEPGLPASTSPGALATRIPSIFGFTRRGWNAFDEMKRLIEAADLLDMFQDARKGGASRRDAMTAVLEASGLESDRAVERRWQMARKAWDDETCGED